MTDTERQAVRQVARRAALLEAAQFLLDVSQRPGTVIKVAGILQLEAARLRAIADRSVMLALADKPAEPEKCRHNTVATRCTECRALGKMVSLK